MPLNILVDECVDSRITEHLSSKGYSISLISKESPSSPDDTVLKIAHDKKAILLTEDSDFGEWIFSHGKKSKGVIFLRYNQANINIIKQTLIKVLDSRKEQLFSKFTVITERKIRIREI